VINIIGVDSYVKNIEGGGENQNIWGKIITSGVQRVLDAWANEVFLMPPKF